MGFRLQYRRYRLPLRAPVRTAHEVWAEREGLIVRIETPDGRTGYGEAAPIPAFGTETIDEIEQGCRTLGDMPSGQTLDAVPAELGCLRHALATAREEIAAALEESATDGDEREQVDGQLAGAPPSPSLRRASRSADAKSSRGVAALLPAGRAVLAAIPPKAEIGFRVFKWKVAVAPLADELALLDDVCAALPSGAKLRLDANGGWDRRQAERWLERSADRPVEFIEQPCFAPKARGETLVRRMDDVLLGLAHDYPTPIALDESVVRDGDVGRWLELGWPGWFVVKPSLLADVRSVLVRLQAEKATVVFSSALETRLGAKAALDDAFSWAGEPKALGFGVWPLFSDARFDGPAAAPFIRAEDVARIDPEAIWSALS